MDNKAFLGRGFKFPFQVDPRTGRLAMVDYEEDIKESIGIILNTVQGERVMRPEFGTNVVQYVFDTVNSTILHSIAFDIQRQLLLQEPRIDDVEVKCDTMDQLSGAITIDVTYTVRSTNNRFNQVYPFYLTEGGRR